MQVIADLQLHSKYSRAVSPEMALPQICAWTRRKGMGLVATGDWTHPLWMREIKANLDELGNGLLKLKSAAADDPLFLLATEVSCIYSQGGRVRRVHTLIWVPSLDSADKINKEMTHQGCNLMSDGRPIVGLTSIQVAELVLTIEPHAMIIPAHCLLPDSMILGENFVPKRIDAVSEGNDVLTHSGEFHKVTEVKKRLYSGTVYHIQPWYFRPGLVTTPEHPYYAIKTIKKCPSTGDICRPSTAHLRLCKRKECLGYKPGWINAEDLTTGDVLVYPRSRAVKSQSHMFLEVNGRVGSLVHAGGTRGRVLANKMKITSSLGRLVGYYLAEGSTDATNSFSFCFSEKEQEYIDDVIQLVKNIFHIDHYRIYRRKQSKGLEIAFYSKLHARWFAHHCYILGQKHSASSKAIPAALFQADEAVQAECLRGWFRGDHGYTTSRVLTNQIKAVCLHLGIIPSIIIDSVQHHANRGNHVHNGRVIHANHDLYQFNNFSYFEDTFDLKKEMPRSQTKIERKHGWIDEDNVYLPIKDITKREYEGDVYNLEVEKDHSYVTEYAAVHNCWTPWFSLYGAMSGFDSIDEAFGPYAKEVYAVETGLSSSPSMNWRIKELDHRSIVSFSDAHSGPKLGREATVFELQKLNYENIRKAIMSSTINDLRSNCIAYTIEFYPEEGKYHYSGHRACNIRWGPKEIEKNGTMCPVCGKPLTQGVEQRVGELAGRSEEELQLTNLPINQFTNTKVRMIGSRVYPKRPPFVMLVPLQEILAECLGSPVASPKVQTPYRQLTDALGGEFAVLLRASHGDIAKIAGERVAVGVDKVRSGDIVIDPGYDGVFGVVKLWREGEQKPLIDASREQLSIF